MNTIESVTANIHYFFPFTQSFKKILIIFAPKKLKFNTMSKFNFLLAFIILLGVQSSFSRISAQTRQSKPKVDLSIAFAKMRSEKIHYSKEFKIDGKSYAIVYAVFGPLSKDEKDVHDVFIVPEGYDPRNLETKRQSPPFVKKAILHSKGPDADTGSLGVIVWHGKHRADGSLIGTTEREIMLPDDIAEPLYHMLLGKTKWLNKSHIELVDKYSMELEPEKFIPAKKWNQ